MDIWKYFGVTHANHLFCNPTSSAKINELISILPLKQGARIFDVACGKAETLIRLVEKFDGSGVGVDLSPYEARAAQQRIEERRCQHRIEFIQGDGADYRTEGEPFDLAMCMGASWIWGGHSGTLKALKAMVVSQGLVIVGEPYKIKEPDPDYIATEPEFLTTVVTHAENVAIGQRLGLKYLYSIVSSQDDWDRYEGLQTLAAQNYARAHPEDPDVDDLLRNSSSSKVP